MFDIHVHIQVILFFRRFIPEDMEFDQEPKSVSQDVPDLATYKPSLFATSALQQSKVPWTLL